MATEATLTKKRKTKTSKKETKTVINELICQDCGASKDNCQCKQQTTNNCVYCGAEKKEGKCNNCATNEDNPLELINQQIIKEYNEIKELLETTRQEESIEESVKAESVKQDYSRALNQGYTNILTIYKMLNNKEVTTPRIIATIKEKSLEDQLVKEKLLGKAEKYDPKPELITKLNELINEIKNECYNTIKEGIMSKQEETPLSLNIKEKPDLETYKTLVSIYEMINRGFKTEAINKIKKESSSEVLIEKSLLKEAREYHPDLNLFGEQEELIKTIKENVLNRIRGGLSNYRTDYTRRNEYEKTRGLMKKAVDTKKPEIAMGEVNDPNLEALIKSQYDEQIRGVMDEIVIAKAERKINELFEKEEFMSFIDLKEAINQKDIVNIMRTLGYKSDLDLTKKEQRALNNVIIKNAFLTLSGGFMGSGVITYPIAFIGELIGSLLGLPSGYGTAAIWSTAINLAFGAYMVHYDFMNENESIGVVYKEYKAYKDIIKQYNKNY